MRIRNKCFSFNLLILVFIVAFITFSSGCEAQEKENATPYKVVDSGIWTNADYALRNKTTNKVTYYRGPLDNPQEYPFPGPNMLIDDCFDCGWVPKGSRAN